MRKLLSLILALTILLGATPGFVVNAAAAEDGYAWVLVDTYQYPVPEAFKPGDPWSYYGAIEGNNIEVKISIPYDIGVYNSSDYSNPVTLHAKYSWSSPPSVIEPKETVSITLEQEIIKNNIGKYSIGFSPNFHLDAADMKLGYGTSSSKNAKAVYSDGTEAKYLGAGRNRDAQSQDSFTANMALQFRDKGSKGQKCALYVSVYAGSPGSLGVRYTYEWKQIGNYSNPVQPSDAVNTSGGPNLTGQWRIIGNGYGGSFNVSNQDGNNFTGTVDYTGHGTQNLINGNLSGDIFTFTRMWDSGTLRQDYTGKLTIDANGKATISGTFTQNGSSSYNWTAEKVDSIASSTVRSDPPSTEIITGGATSEAFESGARVSWNPTNGLGYRMFRSTSKSSLGISVTDFYITSTSYADVNVEPDTTYYYTVKPVIAEAQPFEGIDEKLGAAIATFTVKTGSKVYKPGSYKHFIMLKLDDPDMSVDGASQEVDPGRGTSPMTISGRTMVPIRAVVEAMGGTVGWEGTSQKITLTARGNVVEMWMGKTDIKINGVSKKMDVAPASKNSRTFVPVRFAAENLNCKVDWINSTKEAVIVFEE